MFHNWDSTIAYSMEINQCIANVHVEKYAEGQRSTAQICLDKPHLHVVSASELSIVTSCYLCHECDHGSQ